MADPILSIRYRTLFWGLELKISTINYAEADQEGKVPDLHHSLLASPEQWGEKYMGYVYLSKINVLKCLIFWVLLKRIFRPVVPKRLTREKTRKRTNWWGSAKRDVTHPTATLSIILAIAWPGIDSHGQIDPDNNTTPARSITRKSQWAFYITRRRR